MTRFDEITETRRAIYSAGRIVLEGNRMIPKSPGDAEGLRDAATYNALAREHRALRP